jgi:hypothetical protein
VDCASWLSLRVMTIDITFIHIHDNNEHLSTQLLSKNVNTKVDLATVKIDSRKLNEAKSNICIKALIILGTCKEVYFFSLKNQSLYRSSSF